MMDDPFFTLHAAQQVLKRKLDGREVLAVARDALRAGMAQDDKRHRIERGELVVVLCQRAIITAYQRTLWNRSRRNRRRRRKNR